MKINKLITLVLLATAAGSCGQATKNQTASAEKTEKFSEFVPAGYRIFEEIYGDLNKDGVDDCVLIIKDTNKENFVNDEYRGELDRNRRGIVILFGKGGYYEVVLENKDCFSSENEDGGVYFAPELSVEITKKGSLCIHYAHGRYGWWRYTFRYQNNDFELIGFDNSSDRGPVTEGMTSINFLTKKKKVSINTNADAESGEEQFEVTWEDIGIESLVKLSEIGDFDDLYF
jgi:hypothetical protein